MPDRERHRNGRLRPVVPFKNVDVSAAYGGLVDLDQDVVMTDLWQANIFHPDAAFCFSFY